MLVGTMTKDKITYNGVKFLTSTNYKRTAGALWTSKIRGLKKINFSAIQSSSPTFTLQYSQDGLSWKDTTAYIKTSLTSVSIVLPSPGDYYVRFKVFSGTDGATFFLSTISFYTTAPTDTTGQPMDIVDWRSDGLTLNMNGCDPTQGVSASLDSGDFRTLTEGTSYSYLDQPDRTYSVPVSTLSSGQDLYLQTHYADAEGTQYASAHHYRVPYIFTRDTTIRTASFLPDDDLVIRSGTTTISTLTQVHNVYVYPGASLCVANGSRLCCSNLYIRTTANAAGAVSDTIKAQKAYYTRIVANNTHYFQFALPFASTTQNITSTAGDVFTLDRHWRLNVYDTERRAAQGESADNWVRYTGTTLSPNVGYALLSASPYYREYLFPISYTKTTPTSVAISAPTGEIADQHNGWNYICSPLSGVYSVEYDDPSEAVKITELSDDGTYYLQHIPTSILPAKPFYFQASAAGSLVFGDALSFVPSASAAPSRVAAVSSVPTDWVELQLSDSLQRTDVVNLFIHPTRFDDSYQVGYDLQKFVSTASRPQLYAVLPYGDLSFAALSDTMAQQGIPITTYTPVAGTYTLSVRPNDYTADLAHVYLTDSLLNTTTDLLLQPYTFPAAPEPTQSQTAQTPEHKTIQSQTAQTPIQKNTQSQTIRTSNSESMAQVSEQVYTSRFSVRCVRYADSPTPTATPSAAFPEPLPNQLKKFLHNGRLYILRDGVYFDALGTRLAPSNP